MYLLAHLSDPHLGPVPDPTTLELASKRLLGYLNWRANRAGGLGSGALDRLLADLATQVKDHIAVTGDLINLALDAEMPRAGQWLTRLGKPRDVSVIPGNHDAYVPGALSKATHFWAPYLKGDDIVGGSTFPYLRRRPPVAIFGVNSARATGPFMATGYFEENQAILLRDQLTKAAAEKLCRIVLIHHPPVRESGGWHRRLIGASRFRRVLHEAGAELVLHGHTHRASLNWIAGPDMHIPVVGAPSASAAPGGHRTAARYNMFQIEHSDARWNIIHIERGFTGHGMEFAELSRNQLDR